MLFTIFHLFAPHQKNNHRPKILHTASLLTLFGILIMAQSALTILTVKKPKILGYATNISSEKLISLTNSQRLNNNEKPLTTNDKLNQAALAKAKNMFVNNYWAHTSPEGIEPWFFISQADYRYKHAGENLAKDFSNSQQVVSAWMASPSHKKNILDQRFEDIGIAVVNGVLNGQETTLIVQMFGTNATPEQAPQIGSGKFLSQAYASEGSPQNIEVVLPTFTLSKIISLSFIILLLITLSLDWFFVWQKRLVRISGKNWAHLTFLIAILVTVIIIKHGIVL